MRLVSVPVSIFLHPISIAESNAYSSIVINFSPVHSQDMNRIQHILRVFDLDPAYGPCLGMSRLERWERAEKLGDEPPMEIKEILETREGVLELHQSVLADKGV
jgi:hypothetical protein